MATLAQKIRTLTLSNLHDLLDKAIDLNSIGAIRQYVRDLEAAKEAIEDEAVVAKAGVDYTKKVISDLEVQIKTTNENIELILSDTDPSNDYLAETLEARLIGYEQKLKEKRAELDENQKTADALAEAAARLRAKHEEMMANLRRLQTMERTSAAKERATEALRQAAKAGDVDVSVDNVERRLRERAATADARFERATGTMFDQVDADVVMAQAKQRIAERRAKMTKPS